jgi:hypothetical protein
MAQPYVGEIRLFGGNFAILRMGFLQRGITEHLAKPSTVSAAGHNLRRRRR